MIKVKPAYILLYFIGAALLIFGNRQFWEKLQEENKKKKEEEKQSEIAKVVSNEPFEVQDLTYDSIHKVWKNNHISFHSIYLTNVQFKRPATKANNKTMETETNDDEYASDSL